jgi:hypothetical protein|tara:strand:- start:10838 stop:10981 length:144 start_codon:yes stop_codon:yes gene_type:complete
MPALPEKNCCLSQMSKELIRRSRGLVDSGVDGSVGKTAYENSFFDGL